MSLILDALRRGQRKSDSEAGESPRTANADAVLATLGYSRTRLAPPLVRRLRVYGLWLVILGLSGWTAWWYLAGSVGGPSFPARQVADARTSPEPALAAQPTAPSGARPPEQAVVDAEVDRAPDEEVSVPVPSVPDAATSLPTGPEPTAPAPSSDQRPDDSMPAELPEDIPDATPPVAAAPERVVGVERPPDAEPEPPPPGGGSPTGTEPDHFELALSYHRAGDFENALLHYRALLGRGEPSAEAHNNLGLLYHERELTNEAEQEFQRAFMIDPGYAKAHNNLGVVRLRQGRNDEAAAEFRTALRLDPANVESIVNLALAQRAAGRGGEARETLLQALIMDAHSAPSHYNLARLYEEAGEISRAIDHFTAFLEYGGVEYALFAIQVQARVADLADQLR